MTVEKRKRKYQKNTPVVVTVEKRKKKIPKKYASSGDSEKRVKTKNKKMYYLIVLYEGSTPSRGKLYDGRCKVGKSPRCPARQ